MKPAWRCGVSAVLLTLASLAGCGAFGADAVAQSYPPVIQGTSFGIAIDGAGNRYVAGYFTGTRDFNPGVGAAEKVSAGGADVFVTRFNADGSYGWTQTFGGTSGDYGYDVAVSGMTVYVTGYFSGSGAGVGGTGSLSSSGGFDAFVLALNAGTGEAQAGFGSGGVQKFGGANDDFGLAIAVFGTTVYATGHFSSTDAGVGGTGSIAASGGGTFPDCFVLALDASTGAARIGFASGGVQTFGGTSDDGGRAIAVAGTTVYVAGYFYGGDAGVGGTGSIASSGLHDAFVLALDASTGAARTGFGSGGVQKFGGANRDEAHGIAVTATTVYASGHFSSANAGIGGTGSIAAAGGIGFADAFVLALDASTGVARTGFASGGVQTFGGTDFDWSFAIAVSADTVYASGSFQSVNAGIGGAGSIASSGSTDAFILALDGSDGTPRPLFGSGGVQKFGGTAWEEAYGIAVSGWTVFVTGAFASTNAGVGGTGSYNASGFGGYLLPLGIGQGQMAAPPTDRVAVSYPPIIQGSVSSVAVDASGNRYVAGLFTGSVDFNPMVGADMKSASGIMDAFVTRFNADGSYAWTQTFGGTGYDRGEGVAVSGSTVYVTGYFASANAGFGSSGSIATVGGEDTFVLALEAATGAPLSGFGAGGVQTFGGSANDYGWDVLASGSSVYVCGKFTSTNAGVGGFGTFGPSGLEDAYIMALDAATGAPAAGFGTGGLQKFGGSLAGENAYAMAIGGSTLYVTGSFGGSDAGIGGLGTAASAGWFDAFIIALDVATGSAVTSFSTDGVQTFGGSIHDGGRGIAVSGSKLYISGDVESTNAGIGGIGSGSTSGGDDAFVVALDAATGAAVSSFGAGGIQIFGGADTDIGYEVAVANSTLFWTGSFWSTNAGVGAPGTYTSAGGDDAFIIALDTVSGMPVASFGAGGVQKFGGSGGDRGYGAAIYGTAIYIAGTCGSTDAGVGGTGSFSGSWFGGLLLPLDKATGQMVLAPAITSSLTASGTVGQAFSYTITASNSPANYGATGLPAWASVNTTTGAITGTPDAAVTTNVTISATNAGGTGSATLAITVNSAPPVITSPTTTSGTEGQAFSYTITASNNPASYSATGLPAWASVNTSTGAITGTPNAAGTTNGTISATNAYGTGSASLAITVNPPPPVITSATAASGMVGQAFSYTITASNNPTSYSASGLPAWANVNTSTGTITGTPDAAGTSNVTISATNGSGTGSAALTISINPPPPVITGSTTASGTVGQAFSYTITATNSPTSYNATGMPAGLALNGDTISGMPSTARAFSIILSAANAGGTGQATLTLDVLKGTPIVAWNNPADIVYGTALSAAQLNATASVPGTFAYSPASGTVLNAGAGQTLSAQFTPTDSANYENASASVSINVLKDTPAVSWTAPADIVYGTALSAAQLNATASVPGTVAYSPASGTVLGAGTEQMLSAEFNPADSANYYSVSASVSINVLKAAPAITWNNPPDIVIGTALGATQLDASSSVPGAFTYSPPAGTVLDAGNGQALSVTFAPADSANYDSATAQSHINVLKATPAIVWNNPVDIVHPAALSATQLNATASVAGGFVYTPAFGTVLRPGKGQTLAAQFIPADTETYSSVSVTVKINVKAVPRIFWFAPADIVYGTPLSSLQLSTSANVFGMFTYTPPAGTVLSAGNGQTLSVSFAPVDTANYTNASASVTINVLKATPVVTWNNSADIAAGTALSGTQLNATADVPGTFAYTPAAGTVLSAGNGQALSAQFTPDDAANYMLPATKSVAINVIAQPVISDGPALSASSVTVGQPVSFSCAADQGNVTRTWNFGDGTTAAGASVTHAFSPAGAYTVTVTATNHVGMSVSKTLTVSVAAANAGGRPDTVDSDGDGFSDEIEIGAGTSASSAASTPMENQPAGPLLPLTVAKLATKLNFAKAGADSISFSGTLPLPDGFSAAGQKVIVNVGGVVRTFVLDAKGRSPRGNDSFKLSFKARKGLVAAQTAKFQAKLAKGGFSADLSDDGFTAISDLKKAARELLVTVVFSGNIYQKLQPQLFSAKAGKSGQSK